MLKRMSPGLPTNEAFVVDLRFVPASKRTYDDEMATADAIRRSSKDGGMRKRPAKEQEASQVRFLEKYHSLESAHGRLRQTVSSGRLLPTTSGTLKAFLIVGTYVIVTVWYKRCYMPPTS